MQHRTRSTLESTVLGKRRKQYKEELSHDGRHHDVWFDYARLEEGALRNLREEGSTDEEERATNRVHEVYERAVAQVPLEGEKCHWRHYTSSSCTTRCSRRSRSRYVCLVCR